MRVVLDTNVLMSGIFFGGAPARVLDAWRAGQFKLVASPAILREYARVGAELSATYRVPNVERILRIVERSALMVSPQPLTEQICSDPDDDMFIAAAIDGHAKIIVSGDKALRRTSGHLGISVMGPTEFLKVLKEDLHGRK